MKKGGHYSREDIIQGRTLFKEIRYIAIYVSLAELRKLLNLLCRKSIALSTASFLESVLVVEIVGLFRRKSKTLTLTFSRTVLYYCSKTFRVNAIKYKMFLNVQSLDQ